MKSQSGYKFRRFFALLLSFIMLFTALPLSIGADEADSTDYIEVRTIEELYNIRSNLDGNYVLMNDIDLTEATAAGGAWDFMGNGWNPIGSNDVYDDLEFSGEFDGNGHRITGMRIDVKTLPSGTTGTVYLGLFANVTGSVRNLTMTGSVNYNHNVKFYIGSVAGKCSGVIENCHNTINITGKASSSGVDGYVGGIVGDGSDALIAGCSNVGAITASPYSGYRSSYCYKYAGGIAGTASSKTTIDNCYNTGNVTASVANEYGEDEAYAAGICSRNGVISDCYNTGAIVASTTKSPHFAYAYGIGGTAIRCYNVGKVTGVDKKYAVSAGTSTSCYYLSGVGSSNTGSTSLTAEQMKLTSMYSGFDFENTWVHNSSAEYPYPQLISNPQDLRVIEEVVLSSAPAKTQYAFGEPLDLTGAEITVIIDSGEEQIITVTEDMVSGYDAFSPGVQTITVTYKGRAVTFNVVVKEKVYTPVYNIEDLYNIRNDLDGSYILMNDIDLTEATAAGGTWDFMGNGWNPIGSNDVYDDLEFSGEFDGNGHKIIGMRIDVKTLPSGTTGTVYLGLFANVTGSVRNLTMTGSVNYNRGVKFYIGSVAGKCSGVIENCHNTMNITGKASTTGVNGYVGGIVGDGSDASIAGCSNVGAITASPYSGSISGYYYKYAGGIAGTASSKTTIDNCYNTGSITASVANGYGSSFCDMADAAGICTSGVISDCYNTGAIVASTTKSYDDTYAYGIGGTAIRCYNVGKVTGVNSNYAISDVISTSCYYLSGVGSSNTGSTSLTAEQMKLTAMYPGFDFENIWILNQFANHPYPQLRSNIQDMNESASIVSIISWPLDISYMVGEELVLDGCMIEVTYVSGRKELISVTADMVSGFDSSEEGDITVTVTYGTKSDTFPVTITERYEVREIELISNPDKTQFRVGTAFDFTGAKISVLYADGRIEEVDVTLDMTSGGNIYHLGKQTITVTLEGKTATFDIWVTPVTISSLRLESLPERTEYLEGQELDLTGMVLVAVMTNDVENEVTSGYTVSGYSKTPGTYTVVIGYMGKSVSFEVTVVSRSVVSLTLNSLPNKTEYVAGQAFDPSGMMIVATYDNGDVSVVEDYEVSGFDDVPGLKTVIVQYDGKYVSFPITVISRIITDFKITSYPAKLQYLQYEVFDTTGMEVRATYNDGITEVVTDYSIIGFSSNPGTHTISVAYKGWVDAFSIVVIERQLTNIIVTAPDKLTYYLNENFDPAGMTVTAYYNNGQQIEIEDYEITGFDSKTPGIKNVVVSYHGFTSRFSISVSERSDIATEGAFAVGNAIGRPGAVITIPVTVSKNTGIAGFTHTISFNASDLSFLSVKAEGVYSNGTVIINDAKASDGEITVLWVGNSDIVSNGEVYSIEFEVLESATEGISDITISFDDNDNGNISGENVIFEAVNGFADIHFFWPGDMNSDRKYSMVDLLILAQLVAGEELELTDLQRAASDVNEDGIVDIHDVIMLNQWLLIADM